MNKVILIGNLTKDPERRVTRSGVTTCSFTLAVERDHKDKDGNRPVDFINVIAWRNTADLCARYLTKGRQAAVIGTWQNRSYEDKDGNKRTVAECIADDVQFLGGPAGKQRRRLMKTTTTHSRRSKDRPPPLRNGHPINHRKGGGYTMGKTKNPDFDAIIQKAVNAGRMQGMSVAKDAYKATERRLYAIPVLKLKVKEDREKLEEIKTYGAPQRSKSIVRFSRTGIRLTQEEILEALVMDMEATIAADTYEIECVEKALTAIEADTYYETVKGKYIDGRSDEQIAETIPCDYTTVWRNRKRLVQKVAVMLYGAQAVL